MNDTLESTRNAKRLAHGAARETGTRTLSEVRASVDGVTARRLDELGRPGASSWLSALPLAEHGFELSKGDFRDALALRNAWPLRDVPATCICGHDFTITHAMNCSHGGFPSLRHNEVRDLLAASLTEVCPNVAKEPPLRPVSGEVFSAASTSTADEARLDIRAGGFWTRGQGAFFDVRVFNPDASSYSSRTLDSLFAQHEKAKHLEYGERVINIERGAFTPLVFSVSGAASPASVAFLKRLCLHLSESGSGQYSSLIGFYRCRLSFALLRCAILCIRGARSSRRRPVHMLRELALVEGRVTLS